MNITRTFLILTLTFCLTTLALAEDSESKKETRRKIIETIRSNGYGEKLDAGVTVTQDDDNVIFFKDQGDFFMQYILVGPDDAPDAKITVEPSVTIPSTVKTAVIVTHGWIDKGDNDWPQRTALAIRQKTDPKDVLCAYFDWKGGAAVVNPIDAAKYAKTIAGPRLANSLLKITESAKIEHLHIIAHSAGSWVAETAAAVVAEKTNATVHITFLDAYVPPYWKQNFLGNCTTKNSNSWAEHYYTKDITMAVTEANLENAHNVDITAIDPFFKEHEFPHRWYMATVTSKYDLRKHEKKRDVIKTAGSTEYGFARSKEADSDNWEKSLKLKKGNKAVKIKKQKKPFLGIKLF